MIRLYKLVTLQGDKSFGKLNKSKNKRLTLILLMNYRKTNRKLKAYSRWWEEQMSCRICSTYKINLLWPTTLSIIFPFQTVCHRVQFYGNFVRDNSKNARENSFLMYNDLNKTIRNERTNERRSKNNCIYRMCSNSNTVYKPLIMWQNRKWIIILHAGNSFYFNHNVIECITWHCHFHANHMLPLALALAFSLSSSRSISSSIALL